jgi:phosphoglycolate phosphatase-like HAD superfamily hydrolase
LKYNSQNPQIFAKKGKIYPKVERNPEKYLQPCSEGVKQWLLDLKQKGKVVFLMTSSARDFATTVLNATLGYILPFLAKI